jgi:PAS domain S-box-containing protein
VRRLYVGVGEEDMVRFILDASTEGMLLLDEGLRIVDANAAAAGMLGFPVEKLKGMNALDEHWDLIREDGSPFPKGERPSVAALAGDEAVRGSVLGIRRSSRSECLWVEVGAVRRRLEGKEEPSRILVTFNDITERKKARDRLSRKVEIMNAINDYSIRLADAPWEGLYALIAGMGRSIFGAGAAAIAGYDAGKKSLVLEEIAWSEAAERGVMRLIGRGVKGLSAPVGDEEYRTMMGMKIGIASTLHEFSFGRVPSVLGDAIEKSLGIEWFRGLVLSSQGGLFGGFGLAGLKGQEAPESEELRVFAEITASAIKRKQAEERIRGLLEEKELLLHEVHHRIKNNMSTMISLLSLQARAAKDSEAGEALNDAMVRLQTMSTLYDKLFRSEDLREMSLTEYLPALVREIVAIFPNGDWVEVKTKIEDIRLGVKRLSLVGIIVNELVTNSMKYAFSGRDRGEILVTAKLRKDRVVLRIEDDGVGMPLGVDLDNASGFGLGLVRILTKQLDASIAIEGRAGAGFVLEFDRR